MPGKWFFIGWVSAIVAVMLPATPIVPFMVFLVVPIAIIAPGLLFVPFVAEAGVPPAFAAAVYFLTIWFVATFVASALSTKPGQPFANNLVWFGGAIMLFMDAAFLGACPMAQGLSNGFSTGQCYWPGYTITAITTGLSAIE